MLPVTVARSYLSSVNIYRCLTGIRRARLLVIMLQTTPTAPAALARRPDTAGPLAVATPTTRRLADASLSRNTRRAYLGALARLDAWRGPAPLTDARLAAYLGAIFEAGRAPASAALAVAADRGRGQAAPLRADGLAAILATAERPRTDGRGVESHTTAQRRGRTDAVIAGLLFMGGLRRAEVSALEWLDVSDASDGDGVLNNSAHVFEQLNATHRSGAPPAHRALCSGIGPAKAIRMASQAPPTRHPRSG